MRHLHADHIDEKWLDNEAANPFIDDTGEEFIRCSAIPPSPSKIKI